MESMVNFWRGKKVFITGHTGFKGSWLALWLHSLGAKITGYSLNPPTTTNLFTEATISDLITDIRANVCDLSNLHQTLQTNEPEIIFHLAAQSIVRDSYNNPVETYSTNVMGTVNLLEAIRFCPSVKAVINVTSDKCYANNERELVYKETHPMGGNDPYSSSKGCAELVTSAYWRSFFKNKMDIGIASARGGNVIGGGDWSKDRLIPDIISAYHANNILEVRYPHAIRPWQHVLECLAGYLTLAKNLYEDPLKYAQAWNFGPDTESDQSVAYIIKTFTDFWGSPLQLHNIASEMHEASYLKLDSTKARECLDWQPKLNLNQALNLTVDWFKQFYSKNNARDLCLHQIENYMNGK